MSGGARQLSRLSLRLTPLHPPACTHVTERDRSLGGALLAGLLVTSSSVRIAIHPGVRRSGAFQKPDPKVWLNPVHKDRINLESMTSHHTEATCSNSCSCQTHSNQASFMFIAVEDPKGEEAMPAELNLDTST